MSQPANDEFSQHLSDDEASNHEDASDTGVKEEYDIWVMEMEHYLEYIDNDVWKEIHNGNSKKRISTGKDSVIRILRPVTVAEIQAIEKERKANNILLMAIPKEHMRRFHGMDDAKEIWEAIRTSTEGLEKGYDRFQQLLSQLEAYGAEVSTEDANHKFLISLPPTWSNLAMTMRTKPDVDTLSIYDLYNNLRVFKQEIQGTSKTSSSAQNVAFVSQSKSSTNKVKSGFTGVYSTCTPSTSLTNILEKEALVGFADEIAMIAIRMKKFYKKTRRRVRVDGNSLVGFDKKKLECFNYHNTGHFARECTAKGTHDGKKKIDSFYQHQEAGKQEKNQMGLLTMDDGIVNWGEHTEDEETNHALMAISSSSEVSLCSKTCIDSYNTLKTLCDEQMNQLGDQEAQILAYSQAVKKLEPQLGPQEHEPSVSDDRSSEYSTCQSNDSAGSIGTSSEHYVDPESEISRVPQEVLSHLIKDCDYYEKKMAREAEFKKQRVFNTGNRVEKLVWTNTDRINHANQFVPRPVQRNTDNQYLPGPQTTLVLKDHREIGALLLRPQQVIIGGTLVQTTIVIDQPLKNMVDRGIFDSGCSGHMTGNKDQLEDFEEFNRGSVTFGGSKGYLTGKGRIRVECHIDNESTICIVKNPIYHSKTKHIEIRKVPRHHNMYSFDMKTPTPAKSFSCLITKATFDESKMWHRRFSWVFFLATKDETSSILQNFIRQIENQLNHKVKIIRSDNGTKFKNRDMLEFCGNMGIKQEYRNERTPQ
ncbi:ribonuclease H-like domain-containing protein [Tanacetum coccineum]|uniref:Ribonuclease H-like domain-containing protein n=1 Tax=Tanacetum coccineum TaxID=301880 RepID=A0ABQ4X8R9_9ASTR